MSSGFMTQRHKNALIANRVQFVRDLELDPTILDYLYSKHDLTSYTKQDIELCRTNHAKVGKLLDILPKRSNQTMRNFIHILVKTGNEHLAGLLDAQLAGEEIEARDREAASEPSRPKTEQERPGTYVRYPDLVSQPTQSRDVREFATGQHVNRTGQSHGTPAVRNVNRGTAQEFNKMTHSINYNKMYKMSSYPRGIAIIVNNEVFDVACKLPKREGSSKDLMRAEVMLAKLGFQVENPLVNLCAKDILPSLEKIRDKIKEDHDAFILILMSHGIGDELYGRDGRTVKTRDIISIFNGQNCHALKNKPKLFFIQACRGDTEYSGVVADSPEEGDSMPVDSITSGMADMSLNKEFASIIHELADIFISRSTPPGYKSFRHVEEGSWFIQTFVDKMYELAHEEDLSAIMTEVTAVLNEKQLQVGCRLVKQISENLSYLRKKLYFCPGYSCSDNVDNTELMHMDETSVKQPIRPSEIDPDQTSEKQPMDFDETLVKQPIISSEVD